MPLDLTPAAPELILFLGVLVLLLVGAFRESDASRIVPPLAVLLLVVVALVTVAHGRVRTTAFGGHFVPRLRRVPQGADPAGSRSFAAAARWWILRDERIERYEYALLALFSTLGMCMMVPPTAFALYMALELQSRSLRAGGLSPRQFPL